MFLGLTNTDPLVRGTDPDPVLPFPRKVVEQTEIMLEK
jgi:hypothetical protein